MLNARNLWLVAFSLAIACPAAPAQRADLRKCVIEVPLKRTISLATPPQKLEEKVIRIVADGTQKCEPGKVKWLKDFDAAKHQAAISGRPVLMFAMLGNLDDKFC